jgi:MYXO-CTERM domain-containing protein
MIRLLARLAPGLVCASALGACSAAEPDVATLHEPIFAGTPVAGGEWRAVVALGSCTGVLVTETRVAYAAHCGTHVSEVVLGTNTEMPLRRVPVAACRAHPEAALGNGRDVAYCDLSTAVTDVPPLGLIHETETRDLQAGTPVTLVGFGPAEEGGIFGIQREAGAELLAPGDDLVIGAMGQGTCAGDSGGPALVRLDDLDPNAPAEWRVLGLLSAGRSFVCESGESHYSNVVGVLDFLEAASAGLEGPGRSEGAAGGCSSSPSRMRSPAVLVLVLVLGAGIRRRRAAM